MRAKKYVFMAAVGATTPTDLALKMYPADEKMHDRLPAALKNWETSFPARRDGPGRFFDDIIPRLELAAPANGAWLIKCSLDELMARLPDDIRERADFEIDQALVGKHLRPQDLEHAPVVSDPPSPPLARAQPQRGIEPYHKIWVSRAWTVEAMFDCLQAGRFRQEYYYLTPDAAINWEEFVQAQSYPTYDQCRSGLRALMMSDCWGEATRDQNGIATVVSLAGGGAATKDIVIIEGALKCVNDNDVLNYKLVDISPYMLMRSMSVLKRLLATRPDGGRVIIDSFAQDITTLGESDSAFLRDDRVALFLIAGGTLGNLSEKDFFVSLNKIAKPNDLLIISADTISADVDKEEVSRKLVNKYNHEELYKFITPAIRNIARELRLQDNEAALFRRVRVELEGGVGEHSDVPRSLSVAMSFIADKPINILTSTRYDPDALAEFAGRYFWDFLGQVKSPENPDYLQFLFRRKK